MRRSSALLISLAAFSPALAFADVVILSGGQELRGVVTEEGDRVTVRLDVGSVSFARSEVTEIRRESTRLHELERRRARLDPNDAAGRLELARWAEQNDLFESARELYREVLTLREDDPTARERLGYQKHEGRWLTEEEYLAATGHVRYGGRWVTKEEAARLDREAEERRARRNEERIERLEAQVALQKEKLEELESSEPSEPESYDGIDAGVTGWWLPHHPAFTYRRLLFPHHQRAHGRPQGGLRGRLQAQRGGIIFNGRIAPPVPPR